MWLRAFTCHLYALAMLLACGIGETAAAADSCSKVIVAADPNYPPLHWYDGTRLKGASVEIAERLLSDLGIPYEVRYVGPWARVLEMAKAGQIDMVTSLKINDERLTFLTFLMPPIFANPISVFVRRNHTFAYGKWEDLIGRTGGIARGNIFGGGFDTFMERNLSVETSNTAGQTFRKLTAGHIDYVISGYFTGLATLKAMRLDEKVIALEPMVASSMNYIALSRRSPCVSLVAAANAKLSELDRSGVLAELLDRSIRAWRADPSVSLPEK